jgi:hypothetical protein
MLLTDGESTNRENIKPNLVAYQKQYERLPGTISTFGFGYRLDSALLVDLAETGCGFYSFIPDAGFVGTAFVNAMSNLQVVMGREVYVTVDMEEGLEIAECQRLGGYPITKSGTQLTINLGTLQFGQTKDVIIPAKITEKTWSLTAKVRYELESGVVQETAFAEATDSGSTLNKEVVDLQRCRCMFAEAIPKAVAEAKTRQNEESCKNALQILTEAIAEVEKVSLEDPILKDIKEQLLQDMKGQSTEALAKAEYFNKWGIHYMPSVMFAHRLQQCNNFKDPGVQVYGGKLFKDSQEKADDVFNNLPAPKPSVRRTSTVSHTYTAPASMAAYNDRYAG